MHYKCFSNPPLEGEDDNKANISVDAGLMNMLTRMETGRLKVFRHLSDWFEEKRMYCRKDGRVVRRNEDLMSATRYAIQSLRYANVRRKVNNERMVIAYETIYNPFQSEN